MLPFCSRFIVLTASLSSCPFAMWLCSPSHWEMSLILHHFEPELKPWLALARMWQKWWCAGCEYLHTSSLSHTMWTKEVSLLDVKPLGGRAPLSQLTSWTRFQPSDPQKYKRAQSRSESSLHDSQLTSDMWVSSAETRSIPQLTCSLRSNNVHCFKPLRP